MPAAWPTVLQKVEELFAKGQKITLGTQLVLELLRVFSIQKDDFKNMHKLVSRIVKQEKEISIKATVQFRLHSSYLYFIALCPDQEKILF